MLWTPKAVFDSDPKIQKIFNWYMLAVVKSHRGRGIAKELIRQSLKVAKKAEGQLVTVFATNDISRRIFKQFDDVIVKEIDGNDYKDANGEILFPNTRLTGHFFKL